MSTLTMCYLRMLLAVGHCICWLSLTGTCLVFNTLCCATLSHPHTHAPSLHPHRWFDEADVQPVPKAGSLELVVYSRDELVKLHTAFPSNPPFDPNTYLPNVPWGIVT